MSASLSLIVTGWNVGPYIATALQSAMDADLPGLEMIVVDDGSSDETCAAVDAVIRRNDARARWKTVRFARNTPGGVGPAANAGLEEATGELVGFLDGDDWVDPAALREAVATLGRSGAEMLFTDCVDAVESDGRLVPYPDAALWDGVEGAPDRATLRRRLLRFAPMPWRKLYRRDFIERADLRFPVGPWFFEDTVHHWHAVLDARTIALMRRPLHHHRVGAPAQTIGGRGRKFLAIFEHHDAILALLDARDAREAYAAAFAEWTIRHAWWALERIDASGLYAFWDAARPRMLRHDPRLLDEALQRAGIRPRGAALLAALLAGDRSGFVAMFPRTMLP